MRSAYRNRDYASVTLRENMIALMIVAASWVLFATLITGELF
jgi:hypothetical protein